MKQGRVTSSECSAASCSACGGWPVPASMMTLPNRQCRGEPRPLVFGCDGGRRVGSVGTSSRTGTASRVRSVGPAVGEASQSTTPGPVGSSIPSAVAQSPLRSTSVVGWPCGRPQRQCTGDHRRTTAALCGPTQNHVTPPPTNRGLSDWGKPRRNLSTAQRHANATRRVLRRFRASVASGGVWAPGGLHRLQSGRDERSSSGGFDSRPPPPNTMQGRARFGRHDRPRRIRAAPERHGYHGADDNGGAARRHQHEGV